MTTLETKQSRVRNDLFDKRKGFELGRPRIVFVIWYAVKRVFFLSALPWPSSFKSTLLRLFGAEIGRQTYWKPRVNIHLPWKLKVGDFSWIGEEVCLLNYEAITIGANCCLAPRSFICSGNHNYRSPEMQYQHSPVVLQDGVWIGASAFVGPGVVIGVDAVVTAMSLASHSLEGGWVYSGQPCVPVRRRWPDSL